MFAEDSILVQQNQSLSAARQVHQGPPYKNQDFAISKVPSGSSAKDPMSQAQVNLQASYSGDSTLAVCHEFQPQVPAGRPEVLQMREGDVGPPTPYPICPPRRSAQEDPSKSRSRCLIEPTSRWLLLDTGTRTNTLSMSLPSCASSSKKGWNRRSGLHFTRWLKLEGK